MQENQFLVSRVMTKVAELFPLPPPSLMVTVRVVRLPDEAVPLTRTLLALLPVPTVTVKPVGDVKVDEVTL